MSDDHDQKYHDVAFNQGQEEINIDEINAEENIHNFWLYLILAIFMSTILVYDVVNILNNKFRKVCHVTYLINHICSFTTIIFFWFDIKEVSLIIIFWVLVTTVGGDVFNICVIDEPIFTMVVNVGINMLMLVSFACVLGETRIN